MEKKPLVRTPLTAPEELDAILDGTLPQVTRLPKAEVKAAARTPLKGYRDLDAGSYQISSPRILVRAQTLAEAEKKTDRILMKDPDAVIQVYLGDSKRPVYTLDWPKSGRKV